MRFFLKGAVLGAALLCSTANAANIPAPLNLQSAVLSGFASHHLGTNRDYNEDNHGIGYRFGSSGVMTGYYRNSVRRDSFYAAHESQWAVADNFRVGLIAGAVTGYRYSVIPFVLPEAIARVGTLELALTYAPHVPGLVPALVAVQARWNLD